MKVFVDKSGISLKWFYITLQKYTG